MKANWLWLALFGVSAVAAIYMTRGVGIGLQWRLGALGKSLASLGFPLAFAIVVGVAALFVVLARHHVRLWWLGPLLGYAVAMAANIAIMFIPPV